MIVREREIVSEIERSEQAEMDRLKCNVYIRTYTRGSLLFHKKVYHFKVINSNESLLKTCTNLLLAEI